MGIAAQNKRDGKMRSASAVSGATPPCCLLRIRLKSSLRKKYAKLLFVAVQTIDGSDGTEEAVSLVVDTGSEV